MSLRGFLVNFLLLFFAIAFDFNDNAGVADDAGIMFSLLSCANSRTEEAPSIFTLNEGRKILKRDWRE